ncbi:DHH family [Actinobacillus pleuropneumoniae]|nr:DHH family [Actinobacillus pleuropneumoniae]
MQTYEQELQQVKSFLLEHDDYLVVSHVQPDGDAVSSTLAVGWLLSCLGKKFTMINEGPIPKRMKKLWHAEDILNLSEEQPGRTFSNVICVDCADFARVGYTQQVFADQASIVNIDHHPTNDRYGAVNLVLPEAAATAEILYDLLNLFEVDWGCRNRHCDLYGSVNGYRRVSLFQYVAQGYEHGFRSVILWRERSRNCGNAA